MKEHGITFGSHGMSHSILTTLSPEGIRYEIAESKNIIRNRQARKSICSLILMAAGRILMVR